MISMGNTQKKRPLWTEPAVCFAIFALTLPFLYWFSRIDFDPHHTGLMLKTALDVANGKILFVETFTQYGALVSWIQAFFVRLMGTSITSILFSTCLFYALSYALLYRMARRFLDLPLALVATLISVLLAPFYFWEFNPWSSVFALFFLLLSLLALFHVLEQKHPGVQALCAALAGFLVALTFWCRQPAGIVAAVAGLLFFAISAFFLRKEKKLCRAQLLHLLLFAVGIGVGFVILLIPILKTGAWSGFVTQSIKGMLSFAADRADTEANGLLGVIGSLLFHLFIAPIQKTDELPVLNAIWTLLPIAVMVLALLTLWRMHRHAKQGSPERIIDCLPTLAYVLFAGCAWHQYYPVACYRHWYWGSFLCIPAVIILLHRLIAHLGTRPKCKWLHTEKHRTAAFLAAIALVLAPNAAARVVYGAIKTTHTTHMVKVENPHYDYLNGIYLDADMALYYNDLFDTVHALRAQFPEKNIINLTGNGIYAVFGENFHPMFNNTEDFFYEDYPEAKDAYIQRARPIVIAPEAPRKDYVLYHTMAGDHGDPTAEYHLMPAYIYLPAELCEQIK